MSYFFGKVLKGDFDGVIEKVREGLKEEGFGILTDIDMKATLKQKLDVDYPQYRILGACNPPYAYRALQTEERIGTMLPCHVVVREVGENQVEVAAVDPVASMKAVENPQLIEIAREIQAKLRSFVEKL